MCLFDACLHTRQIYEQISFLCATFASDVKTCKLMITSKLTKRCKCAQKRNFGVFTWISKHDQTRRIDEIYIGW